MTTRAKAEDLRVWMRLMEARIERLEKTLAAMVEDRESRKPYIPQPKKDRAAKDLI